MDEGKPVPPKSGQDSQKPGDAARPHRPSPGTLALIQRAALAMSDRKRLPRPAEPPAAKPPLGPEPPEPFIADTSDMVAPRASLKPPPGPRPARPPKPPAPVADRAAQAKLANE